ncbi:ATP-binding protein [Phocoenobacter skyensis]|uniref:ATP-binding protein n=1 Tax=Phocoenobacter skyensis TaxID=97481 RepID=A0ABT9JKF4_9PAST|nr:ATP-binding protein [Pasteurella skyensis]MDP8078370.1 ATP-binding protein [Pasteurella skyensis]MDP8084538.1 ATP-binding protein [Pasteurella skyensis]
MSIATLILGESGTGKSASLRNLDPEKVLLIQVVPKPLPFKSTGWKVIQKDEKGKYSDGNILVTDNADLICNAIMKSKKDIIIIDDYQYIMANEFMRRGSEKGFDKFTEIGVHGWQVVDCASKAHTEKRVYILAHTQSDDLGKIKIKTIGKMVDEKITLEGLFTICLRTQVGGGEYKFSTQNNGSDTVKSPIGLFQESEIDNDLNLVDNAICDYYDIKPKTTQEQEN